MANFGHFQNVVIFRILGVFWSGFFAHNTLDLPQVDCERGSENEGQSPETSEEVAKRERESTCSACGMMNLICILLGRKNWV